MIIGVARKACQARRAAVREIPGREKDRRKPERKGCGALRAAGPPLNGVGPAKARNV